MKDEGIIEIGKYSELNYNRYSTCKNLWECSQNSSYKEIYSTRCLSKIEK